jgi:hypothetical protein
MKDPKKKEVPFFARYLEGQKLKRVRGGEHFVTLKYPSDDDEYVTLKYPSDDDELTE